ncbi:MAG: DNA recombination protein RmuC [Desulfococcaceae bacterium]
MNLPLDPWTPLAAAVAAGLLAGLLIGWTWSRAAARRDEADLRVRLSAAAAERDAAAAERDRLLAECRAVREERHAAATQVARLEQARRDDAEKLAWMERAETRLRESFESLAGKSLAANAESFLRQTRETSDSLLERLRGDWRTQKAEMGRLVHPVKESLSTLEGHIRDLEQKREGAYQGLEAGIRELSRAQSALHSATLGLAQALRSPTVRGRWGEFQLRRVVEMSGMSRHVAFSEQKAGENGRPDLLVHLPGEGVLPVDAKAPLEAYLDAAEAESEADRRRRMADHVRAMQARVRELAGKRYWAQFEQAPDFVVMFVPSEACLGAAFEAEPGLLEFAVEQRVLIASPVTLIALLRSVAWGWQQHRMTENARRVAAEGRELYRRLATFNERMAELGRLLNRAVGGYNKAVGSLEHRLTPSARRLGEMGLGDAEPDGPDGVAILARPLVSAPGETGTEDRATEEPAESCGNPAPSIEEAENGRVSSVGDRSVAGADHLGGSNRPPE